MLQVFACRVCVGEYCKGENNATAPPYIRDQCASSTAHYSEYARFNSTVDNVLNPEIYVTYNDAQAYPEYLLAISYEIETNIRA